MCHGTQQRQVKGRTQFERRVLMRIFRPKKDLVERTA
jgi:hypothetical protein